ncbi:uncharacterized protein LOC118434510 isoform X2 [Folsomia candida]|uniref:Uncharacterized protein n=1 Tax=Folsomia candida TaxID=158441 RepID=A0A226ETX8_FOLCA|nr:uncharacterized protein LOC118434510 isoform X2 [Folsomia candida]OXA60076.1 hypothetical protein Fcan01_04932 [Folsomia candida]
MGALLAIILTLNVVLFATILQPYVFNNKRIGGGKPSLLLGSLGSVDEDSKEEKHSNLLLPPGSSKPPGINGEIVAGVYGSGVSHIVVGHLLMAWIYAIAPGLGVLLALFTLLVNTDFSYLQDPDPYNLQSLQHELDPLLPPSLLDQKYGHDYFDGVHGASTHVVEQFVKPGNTNDRSNTVENSSVQKKIDVLRKVAVFSKDIIS